MSFLKYLFSDNTNDDTNELANDFAVQVERAIKLLSISEASITDEEIVQLLIANEIRNREAIEILIFLPIAFCRHWLKTVNWPDTYIEFIDGKYEIEKAFSKSKSYQIIFEVTSHYFNDSPDPKTVIKIGGRSAEFDAINQLLNENPNAKLEDVIISKTVLLR